MMKKFKPKAFRALLSVLIFVAAPAGTLLAQQVQVIDRIIAVVGKNMILESDIEAQYQQYRMQGSIKGSAEIIKCDLVETMLMENLLLNQAELDSVEVADSEVEQSLDQRLRYFISQFGSQEKLE